MPGIASFVITIVSWIVLIAAVVAFIDVLRRPSQAFPAVGRLTKPAWLILNAVAALAILAFGWAGGILGLAASVVVLVYWVDVRPKVVEITR